MDKPKRQSTRLKGWNYSKFGYYFITICTHNRKILFGNVKNGKMILNDLGKIIQQEWSNIPSHYSSVKLDEFIVMPNHIHGILILNNYPVEAGFTPTRNQNKIVGAGLAPARNQNKIVGAGLAPARSNDHRATARVAPTIPHHNSAPTLGNIIGSYKSICFKQWRQFILDNHINPNNAVLKFWQRNYYEHIIRNQKSLDDIREYINYNPDKWQWDQNNPINIK